MRWFVFIAVCLFSAMVHAETMYVDDTIKLGLRDEPGFNNKIRETIDAGPVEVVKTENEWSFVRLHDGREGWIANRFVTSKKPNAIEVKEMKDFRKKYDKFSEQISALTEENRKLRAENEKLTAESDENQKKINELSSAKAEAQKVKPPPPQHDKPALSKSEPEKTETKKTETKKEDEIGGAVMEFLRNIGMSEIKGALIGVGILLLGISARIRQRSE